MADKAVKGGGGYSIIKFEALTGIVSSQRKILDEIVGVVDKLSKNAVKNGRNIEIYVAESIDVFLDVYSLSDLNLLKNFLGVRKLDFIEKQEEVKYRVDTMVEECGVIVGGGTYASLIGAPANFTNSMEKLVINHIRQRNLAELDITEKFLEAVRITVKQTKVFRQVEEEMRQLGFIESLLATYVEMKMDETKPFIRDEGVVDSQSVDGDVGDENTEEEG
jgi:hypothetical protein